MDNKIFVDTSTKSNQPCNTVESPVDTKKSPFYLEEQYDDTILTFQKIYEACRENID